MHRIRCTAWGAMKRVLLVHFSQRAACPRPRRVVSAVGRSERPGTSWKSRWVPAGRIPSLVVLELSGCQCRDGAARTRRRSSPWRGAPTSASTSSSWRIRFGNLAPSVQSPRSSKSERKTAPARAAGRHRDRVPHNVAHCPGDRQATDPGGGGAWLTTGVTDRGGTLATFITNRAGS